jgi:hypothetical protein
MLPESLDAVGNHVTNTGGKNQTDDEGDECHERQDVADDGVDCVAPCLVKGSNNSTYTAANSDQNFI